MSYRSQKIDRNDDGSKSSSSEDELSGPSSKVPRINGQKPKTFKGSKSGHMWSSFLEEQVLTEHLSSRADISSTHVERGVESYEAPDFKNEQEPKHVRNIIEVGRFRKQHNRARIRMNTGKTTYGKNFGRNRGFLKRSYNRSKEQLVSSRYSLESLMSAEFSEGLTIDQLGKEIAEALGEAEGSVIPSVVRELGEERALKLFNEVRDIEVSGGMKILDGSRRRTPGGVYMVLFKSDPDISQIIKQKIVKLNKDNDRCIRRGKRRNQSKEPKQLPTAAAVFLKNQVPIEQKNEVIESADTAMDTSH